MEEEDEDVVDERATRGMDITDDEAFVVVEESKLLNIGLIPIVDIYIGIPLHFKLFCCVSLRCLTPRLYFYWPFDLRLVVLLKEG